MKNNSLFKMVKKQAIKLMPSDFTPINTGNYQILQFVSVIGVLFPT